MNAAAWPNAGITIGEGTGVVVGFGALSFFRGAIDPTPTDTGGGKPGVGRFQSWVHFTPFQRLHFPTRKWVRKIT